MPCTACSGSYHHIIIRSYRNTTIRQYESPWSSCLLVFLCPLSFSLSLVSSLSSFIKLPRSVSCVFVISRVCSDLCSDLCYDLCYNLYYDMTLLPALFLSTNQKSENLYPSGPSSHRAIEPSSHHTSRLAYHYRLIVLLVGFRPSVIIVVDLILLPSTGSISVTSNSFSPRHIRHSLD